MQQNAEPAPHVCKSHICLPLGQIAVPPWQSQQLPSPSRQRVPSKQMKSSPAIPEAFGSIHGHELGGNASGGGGEGGDGAGGGDVGAAG
jgi:hypothetical protein